MRPGQPSCLGGLKGARGCGNDVPLLCFSVSGFPDLRALRPCQAQAPAQQGAIPMPLALGKHRSETGPGWKVCSTLSLFLAPASGP